MVTDTLSRHHLDHTTDKAQGDKQVDRLEPIKFSLMNQPWQHFEITCCAIQSSSKSSHSLSLIR